MNNISIGFQVWLSLTDTGKIILGMKPGSAEGAYASLTEEEPGELMAVWEEIDLMICALTFGAKTKRYLFELSRRFTGMLRLYIWNLHWNPPSELCRPPGLSVSAYPNLKLYHELGTFIKDRVSWHGDLSEQQYVPTSFY